MLAVYQRFGVIDVSGTAALGVLHTGLAVAYLVPGLAASAVPATPGRVSVVSSLDALGPVWQVAFGLTALLMFAALYWTEMLFWAHALGAGAVAIFTAALWFGWAASDPRPSIISSLFASAVLVWHIVLVVTYNAARSLPVRAGGRRSRKKEG